MVGGATHYNGFALRLSGLPTEACAKVASVDFGGSLSSMDVFSGTAFVLGLTKPMTPAAAGTLCNHSNSSMIVWRFYLGTLSASAAAPVDQQLSSVLPFCYESF